MRFSLTHIFIKKYSQNRGFFCFEFIQGIATIFATIFMCYGNLKIAQKAYYFWKFYD